MKHGNDRARRTSIVIAWRGVAIGTLARSHRAGRMWREVRWRGPRSWRAWDAATGALAAESTGGAPVPSGRERRGEFRRGLRVIQRVRTGWREDSGCNDAGVRTTTWLCCGSRRKGPPGPLPLGGGVDARECERVARLDAETRPTTTTRSEQRVVVAHLGVVGPPAEAPGVVPACLDAAMRSPPRAQAGRLCHRDGSGAGSFPWTLGMVQWGRDGEAKRLRDGVEGHAESAVARRLSEWDERCDDRVVRPTAALCAGSTNLAKPRLVARGWCHPAPVYGLIEGPAVQN